MNSNIIRKAQISADVQLCRNLNTVLANAKAENRIPQSVYDVLYLENEAGYIIENLNPTTDGMYFAWDQASGKMIYLMADLETVYYPEDYDLVPGQCWITVGSASEAAVVAAKGYNLALEKDINEEITLSNVVSINTLGFKAGNVTFNGDSSTNSVETAYLVGQFGQISGSLGGSSVVQSGSATSVSVSSNSAASSVTVKGYVNNFSVSGSSSAVVSGTGLVNNVTGTSAITNNGVVVNGGSSTITGSGATGSAQNNVVSAGSKEDLDSIRTQVASGYRTFKNETIKLSSDVNLSGIAFTPIANVSREGSDAGSRFQGTFDGNGCTIKNFATSGFSITGLNAGTNNSTPKFTEAKVTYNEAVYGLFGVTENAVIKNLTIECDIDLVLDHSMHYVGDSVGGFVGCAFGTIEFINCTVNGSIKGYDGVGGFLGRLKGSSATFTNCTNNATVVGVRKTGGFIGSSYTGTYTVNYNNCVNNGNIQSLGIEKDLELVAWDSKGEKKVTGTVATSNYSGYYTASASNGEYLSADFVSGTKANNVVNVNGFTNNGTIMVGSVAVGNGTYYNASTGKMEKGN